MSVYKSLSSIYDLLDKVWFADRGKNPRDVIENLIPNEDYTILDLCCGTFSNGLPIARKNPNNHVVGLDRSEDMLREANTKVQNAGLTNVEFVCKDATNTEMPSKSFDYIIIGLVLHECSASLKKSILCEAARLLKPHGKIIILDWDKQTRFSRKLKFAFLFATEALGMGKEFTRFYYSDKKELFQSYGFTVTENIECNYTCVLTLKKSLGGI